MSEPTSATEHDLIQSLLGAYALDATDPEESALVERHLPTCVRCATEVVQHHEVAGLLANSGGEAPDHVWDGIAERLEGSAPPEWSRVAARLGEPFPETEPADGPTVVPLERAATRRSRRTRVAGTLVAAAAVVVAVALGVQVAHLHDQLHTPPLTRAEQAALALPSTRHVHLSPTAPSTRSYEHVMVVLTASGTGFVEAGRLSGLPSGRTYQLWGLVDGRAVSLGLLGPAPQVVPFSAAGEGALSGFAITDEAAGGAIQPSSTPVVQGSLA